MTDDRIRDIVRDELRSMLGTASRPAAPVEAGDPVHEFLLTLPPGDRPAAALLAAYNDARPDARLTPRGFAFRATRTGLVARRATRTGRVYTILPREPAAPNQAA